jgi:hypothetical protein
MTYPSSQYPGFQPGGAVPPAPPRPAAPGVAAVVVVTVLFGVFGAIPAAVKARKATRLGYPTGKYWKAFGITIAVMVGLAVVLAVTAGRTPAPASVPGLSPVSVAPAVVPDPTAADYQPVPGDFVLKVTVLTKDCFGSAGCDLTYRVTPTYQGQLFDPSQQVTVTYSITGGDDGAQIGSFSMTGDGQAVLPSEDVVTTASSSSRLVAAVVDVLPG